MRKLKKYAQVDIVGDEGLYETTVDRWSRNAKHHLSQAERVSAKLQPVFEEGEMAIYESKEVEVKIPQGPKNTIGVVYEGKLKMVHEKKLSKKVAEGVMGGMKSMPAINRIMQLAGLEHSGATVAEPAPPVELQEDAAGDMLSKLVVQAENMPEFKGNAEAARLYTIGSILSMLGQSVRNNPPQTVIGQAKAKELNAIAVMGADLIKSAQTLTSGTKTTQEG